MLSEIVDALQDVGVSVGRTTNMSIATGRREADVAALVDGVPS